MTYYESAAGLRISAERVAAEIRAHGLSACDFFAEVAPGTDDRYAATEVLEWLGY